MKNFPKVFDFFKNAGNEESGEVKIETDKIVKSYIDKGLENVYENINFTKFREDIDLKKTINIINWTMLNFAEQQSDKLNSFENINMELLEEWDIYFDIFKRCFYKEEEQ